MPSSSWFIMWQCSTKRPVKSRKRERKVTLPLARHHHRVAPDRLGQLLAVDRDHLEGIGVDVEDVVVLVLVDDDPFLDRAQGNALIDPVGVELPAADQIGEFLVVGGRRKLRLLRREASGAACW